MTEFSDFLEGQSGSEVESCGEFTVDASKAREKLRQFQAADDAYFLRPLLQALVQAGADEIEIEAKWDRFLLETSVGDLLARDIRDGWDSIGTRNDAVGQMILALNAALSMEPRELVWSQGTESLCLREQSLRPRAWANKARLVLRRPRPKKSFAQRLMSRGLHLFRHNYWEATVRDDFSNAPVAWRLNGKAPGRHWPRGDGPREYDSTALVRDYLPPAGGGAVWVQAGEFETHREAGEVWLWAHRLMHQPHVPFMARICSAELKSGLLPVGAVLEMPLKPHFVNSVVYVVRHGVCVERVVTDLGAASTVALVAGDDLHYDLSGKVVRDRLWDSRLAELRVAVRGAAKLVLDYLGASEPFLRSQPRQRPVNRTAAGYQRWQEMIRERLEKVVAGIDAGGALI